MLDGQQAGAASPARFNDYRQVWLVGLACVAILIPAVLFGAIAWRDRLEILHDVERTAQLGSSAFEQHARNVFQTHSLVASLVNEHIAGTSWEEIASSQVLHRYLAEVAQRFPQMRSLWLIDPLGRTRASSAVFPTPSVSVADRDYFLALRDHDVGPFIGQPVHGRVFAEDIFNVAQRRVNSGAGFDGLIVVSAVPGYFETFWDTRVQRRDTVSLVRKDGTYLARKPQITIPRMPSSAPLMQAIGANDDGHFRALSVVDGEDRMYAFRRVAGLPVYVVYGISVGEALKPWYQHLLVYGAFFCMSGMALALLAMLALRAARREAAAIWHLQDTVKDLEQEIMRRSTAERQLHQAQKMEALGQVTGGMAHDFGNILNVITGNLELVLARGTHAVAAPARRALDAADRAAKAIRAMLTFARQQPQDPEVFDLTAAVHAMDEFLHQAVGPRVALDIVLPAESCLVAADRAQTELAILNLAVNARDAMPNGGRLTIAVELAHREHEPSVGRFAAITVQDDGVGMTPEVISRVFEPFFTTKEAGNGTGLGMSMVHGFARQSRGRVSVDSTVGRGTKVIIYLPMASPADDAQQLRALAHLQ